MKFIIAKKTKIILKLYKDLNILLKDYIKVYNTLINKYLLLIITLFYFKRRVATVK